MLYKPYNAKQTMFVTLHIICGYFRLDSKVARVIGVEPVHGRRMVGQPVTLSLLHHVVAHRFLANVANPVNLYKFPQKD